MGAEIPWPTPASEAMQVLNVLNVNLSLFGISCTLTSFSMQYVVSVTFPLMSLLSLALSMVILRGVFRIKAVSWAVFTRLTLTGLSILFIPLARASLVYFDCTLFANGEWRLDADYSVLCFDRTWFSVLPVAIAACVLYVVGIPLAMLVALLAARKTRFSSMATLATYGFMYRHLRSRYYMADLVATLHRLVVVILSLFLSNYLGYLLASFQILFAAHGFFFIHYAPLYVPFLNIMEAVLDGSLLIVVTVGWLFVSDLNQGSSSALILACILVVAIGVTLAYVATQALHELHLRRHIRASQGNRDIRRERFWRFYDVVERHDWGDREAVLHTDDFVSEKHRL